MKVNYVHQEEGVSKIISFLRQPFNLYKPCIQLRKFFVVCLIWLIFVEKKSRGFSCEIHLCALRGRRNWNKFVCGKALPSYKPFFSCESGFVVCLIWLTIFEKKSRGFSCESQLCALRVRRKKKKLFLRKPLPLYKPCIQLWKC